MAEIKFGSFNFDMLKFGRDGLDIDKAGGEKFCRDKFHTRKFDTLEVVDIQI